MMTDPIAIVGFSFRLPGDANTPDRLWEILAGGEQVWTDVPESRYNWQSFHHPDPDAKGTHNARGGFFLNQDIAEFDAKFFGIPDAEAVAMDPQQRLLLEVSYEALENAGMPIEGLRGTNTGVYIALVSRDYDRQIYKDPSQIPKHHLTGCGDAVACGRISYMFDFRGPSMTIDTGCSGGLVGIHLACQALRLRESNMALVGGANLLLGPDMTVAMSNLHMINENGRCYPFDCRGAGYGRAEGVAVLVLKRLSDAERNGDTTRAVILNSGVGQDGKTNGILLPNSNSQQRLTASLYEKSGLDPQETQYVEMHGTGTAAGDAAEIRSIQEVFVGDGSRRQQALTVGSIKANLGHSESTSGLSGILSVVLSMERGLIPPVAALQTLKPEVSLAVDSGKIKIPRKVYTWPTGSVRRASVNSFGFGGTNAHVILEGYSRPGDGDATGCYPTRTVPFLNGLANGHEFHDQKSSPGYPNGLLNEHRQNGAETKTDIANISSVAKDDEPLLFVITAKSKESLKANIENLRWWINKHEPSPDVLFSLSRTLATRRSAFNWRASIVGKAKSDIITSMSSTRLTKTSSNPKTIFLFTGQGAQYAAMGRELLHLNTTFSYSLQKSQEILRNLGASWDLMDELRKPEWESRINSSQLSQPATTAIQIALVSLLAQLGVHPVAVLGHSSGEVAAAYAAGMLSHEAALQISYQKGFVAEWCREVIEGKGAMLAVGLGEKDVCRYLDNILSGRALVACVNSPSSVTISGDEAAVVDLKILLDRDSIFNRRLKVDIAYHSHHMYAVARKFEESLHGLTATAPLTQTKFFSSVTGSEYCDVPGPSYWVDNLVSTVRFSEVLDRLARECGGAIHDLVFVEVGPHSALEGPIRQTMGSLGEKCKWSYSPTLVRKRDPCQAVLEMSGRLWEQGLSVDINQSTLLHGEPPRLCSLIPDLPGYSWDHSKRYWHESRLSKDYRHRPHPPHDLLGLRLIGTTTMEPVFRLILSIDDLPWLQEHLIDRFALYPGSAFLVQAIEGLKKVTEERGERRKIERYHFKDVNFTKSIVVPDSPGAVEVLLSLKPARKSGERLGITWHEFRITSQAADGSWNDNCHGLVGCEFAPEVRFAGQVCPLATAAQRVDELTKKCNRQLLTSDLYDGLRRNGIDYGDNFSIIKSLKIGKQVCLGKIEVPDIAKCMPSGHLQHHVIHPATFDAFMHIALPLYHRFCSEGPVMLTSIGEASISANILNKPGDSFTVVCDLKQARRKFGAVNVSIMQEDDHGQMVEVGSLTNEEFRGIGEGFAETTPAATRCYSLNWVASERTSALPQERLNHKLQLCSFSQSDQANGIVKHIISHLSERADALILPWNREPINSSSIQVVIEEDFLSKLSTTDMSTFFAQVKSVLWITICPSDGQNSAYAPLARNMAKINGVHFVSLACQDDVRSGDTLSDLIAEVITKSFAEIDNTRVIDFEYEYRRGTLFVPRLQPHEDSNRRLKGLSCDESGEHVAKFHCGKALKLDFKNPGLLSSARFVPNSNAESQTASDEIKVKVYAHGVNRSDVAVATGRANSAESMVGEFAGVVIDVGTALRSEYKAGDRVCGWGAIPYANIVRINHHFVQHLDDSISFERGAAIPLAFQTVCHALMDIVLLQESHRILIHGAAGAVGQAAISIAQHIGADIYATVGSEEKARLVTEATGLTRDHIFSNRSTAFQNQIDHQTGGQGVDVVLNCSSGDLVDASVPCLSDLGVIINIVKSDITFSTPRCNKNISYTSVNMNALKAKYRQRLHEKFGRAMAMYKSGGVRCPSLAVMPITDIEKAFRVINSEKHVGKLVLSSDDQVYVRQTVPLDQATELDRDGSYAVLGGTPNLNESLCTFLADRGAADIVGIAFTNGSSGQNFRPLQHFYGAGTRCEWFELDVSNPLGVEDTMARCRERLASVQGIFSIEPIFGASETTINGELRVNTDYLSRCTTLVRQLIQHHAPDFIITLSQRAPRTGEAIGCIMPTDTIIDEGGYGIPNHQTRQIILRMPIIDSSVNNNQISPNEISSRHQGELSEMLGHCLCAIGEREGPREILVLPTERIELDWRDALFSDIRRNDGTTAVNTDGPEPMTLEQEFKQAKDPQAITRNINSLVCERLAAFCAVDRDDIRMDAAIVDVGLDSLLAIEFKNWIMRTFQAPMQTTEILDASSLHDLVSLIAQRSKFISKHFEHSDGTPVNGHSERPSSRMSTTNQQPDGPRAIVPPPLPLPSLGDLIERHLSGVRPFASDEEFSNTLRLAQDFCAEGGPGVRLYERLRAMKAADPENWYHDLFLNNQYLSRKGPLAPYALFFFTHPLGPVKHSQAERAALIASTLIRYKGDLEKGLIKPQYMNEQQLCMDLHKNLFSACREPRDGLDVFEAHPGNDFFIILRRGHAFKIEFRQVLDDNLFDLLRTSFTEILNTDLKEVDWLGILSGEHRTLWAKNYRDFVEDSPQNAEYVRTIQQSAFIICLDESSPENAEQRARQVHFGDGSNRWFDKSIEYVICSNGISGILADHTGLDAPTVQDINLAIAAAIREYDPSLTKRSHQGIPFERVVHTNFGGYQSNVPRARASYQKTIAKRQHFFTSLNFGSSFMREHKVPPNSGFQLIVQLAARYFFGYIPACWETVLQTIFHKGRVEINQVISMEVAEFVKTAADETAPLSVCRRKLIEAARRHSGNILAATRSGGSDRFLSLLREISKDGEEDPELYKDPPYVRSRPRKIMSSCFRTHMAENGCVQRDDDSIWLHFEVDSERYAALLRGNTSVY
ncbi:uncharacterized protein Z518_08950 [Rhinocladiella mackenziei CBS 650.93]|uniref:Carrier domain-containing protein n=1 Tax=Rhinocladiella mackenziei CBS 650.93 TaxID=1442369 RepID=A0A0D2IX95_9EURO|nr:uncharacterized protein Z518_08950 [Rhinocladiella mackenziei CBS 650.93]KIX01225.1 hypothetical protein Z518_08950 [Rhinocladiella mackenziei CBS 650.93]